jgi:ElaB/YqjD/DUF883 family membrane-anchored ribosome-binding protein
MYTAKDDTVRTLKNTANDMAREAKGDLRDAANTAGRKVRKLFDTTREELSQATDTVTTQIRNKPVQSSLIALAAGVVLGALIRR